MTELAQQISSALTAAEGIAAEGGRDAAAAEAAAAQAWRDSGTAEVTELEDKEHAALPKHWQTATGSWRRTEDGSSAGVKREHPRSEKKARSKPTETWAVGQHITARKRGDPTRERDALLLQEQCGHDCWRTPPPDALTEAIKATQQRKGENSSWIVRHELADRIGSTKGQKLKSFAGRFHGGAQQAKRKAEQEASRWTRLLHKYRSVYVAADSVDVKTSGSIYCIYTARNWYPTATLGIKES